MNISVDEIIEMIGECISFIRTITVSIGGVRTNLLYVLLGTTGVYAATQFLKNFNGSGGDK